MSLVTQRPATRRYVVGMVCVSAAAAVASLSGASHDRSVDPSDWPSGRCRTRTVALGFRIRADRTIMFRRAIPSGAPYQ